MADEEVDKTNKTKPFHSYLNIGVVIVKGVRKCLDFGYETTYKAYEIITVILEYLTMKYKRIMMTLDQKKKTSFQHFPRCPFFIFLSGL